MKNLSAVIILFYMIVNAMSFIDNDPVVKSKYNSSGSNNEFMIKVYNDLITDPKNVNIFFSPYSISSALAMTFAGSSGDTEVQMAKALEFSCNKDVFHNEFSSLTNQINTVEKKGNVELSIANSLWMQEGFKFLDKFIEIGKDKYNAEIRVLNFAESEKSRQIINKWVENKTNDKIKDLIPKGIIDALTRLILTNAVYFKGEWKNQFKKNNNQKSKFYTEKGEKSNVVMMHKKASYGYMENEKFQFLEMPYKGNDVSMFVLLPKEKNGLKDIEISMELINSSIDGLQNQDVRVFFPKFKQNLSYELRKLMSRLGMVDAFTKKADFSKMTGTKELYISAIIHKTFIDINETGTEAAAATAVVMRMKSAMPVECPEFRADHPFFYFIRENSSGAILFAGKLSDPEIKN